MKIRGLQRIVIPTGARSAQWRDLLFYRIARTKRRLEYAIAPPPTNAQGHVQGFSTERSRRGIEPLTETKVKNP